MIKIALSGGIGAGKSAAALHFERRGALVVSADRIGHEVLAAAGEARDEVVRRWPQVAVEGVIDRTALAEIVFQDPEELAALEAITHPAIRAEIARRVDHGSAPMAVVEIPLLAHGLGEGWIRVVVDAPDEVRRARLRDRGMDGRDIAARMAAQPSRAAWLQAADHVIDNSGSQDLLESEVGRLWGLLTSV